MVDELLQLKNEDYRGIIEQASKKLGVNKTTFLRMAAVEKANQILSMELKSPS